MPDDDEATTLPQNGENGHVDNPFTLYGHAPLFLEEDMADDEHLSNGWSRPLSLPRPSLGHTPDAPHVSPAAGAIVQSPTLPPLDLYSRLEQQQGSQLQPNSPHPVGYASPATTSIRDFAEFRGEPETNGVNGSHAARFPS